MHLSSQLKFPLLDGGGSGGGVANTWPPNTRPSSETSEKWSVITGIDHGHIASVKLLSIFMIREGRRAEASEQGKREGNPEQRGFDVVNHAVPFFL